jgi:hypothetical protein
VKANAALHTATKATGVPVYAVIKSMSTSKLIKAFRTLLGVEPATGGFFGAVAGGGRADSDDEDASGGATLPGGGTAWGAGRPWRDAVRQDRAWQRAGTTTATTWRAARARTTWQP